MEIERQIHTPAAPLVTSQAESGDSKSKRGGKRPGAGRKPNLAKRLLKGLSPEALREAMSTIDVGAVVQSLLRSKRERTKLETLIFVWDRLYGRTAQNVQLSGGLLHAHTVWRPLADLTDAEVQMLDTITKKLTTGSDASQNAPQNQIESKPATEAEAVE